MHVRVFFQLCNMWWMCLPLAEIAWSVFTSLLPRSSMNRSYLLWKWAHALFKGSWPSVLVLVSSVWLKKRKNEQMRASQKQPLKFAKKKKQAFFWGGGESFMGSLQHHQGAQQHNSSSKHDRVCRHFVLPVSDGQSPTDDLYAALPAGVEDFMILLHIAPPPHTLILVPRVISTMDRSWKLYQKGFDPVMTLRQQVPVHWVIHDPKVVRLLLN